MVKSKQRKKYSLLYETINIHFVLLHICEDKIPCCDPNRYVSQCFSQAIYQCSKARGKRTLTLAHPWLMYSMWYKLFRHFIYTLLLAPITFDFTLYASECFGMFYLFMLFIACTKLS